jgi:hypothetical protein
MIVLVLALAIFWSLIENVNVSSRTTESNV